MKAATNKKLACDDLWNDRQAHFAMQNTIEQNKQDDIRVINMESAKKEADRKQSVNEQFWHSMKEIIFVIACAAIAVYTLIHFA